MEPELQVLPILLYLLLYQEQQRRWRQQRTSLAASDSCPLGMIAMSAVVALSEHVAGLVAVVVAEVLAVVHVSAPVEGHSRTSPAALDGCPLGMMQGTVAEAADVQVAVQVAVQVVVQLAVHMAVQVKVSNTVQVDVLVDGRGDSGHLAGGSVPCPDLPFASCSFPTFDVAAGPLALSPFGLEEPLVGAASSSGMWAPSSPWQVAEWADPWPR
ncbi:hypothetical protein NDU88_001032 [Pleurodeles waltl]|uniref:Uncharacterized protein n=1 Tax=Pleurodeles waltl TaxID=8319 RepID=A0AAV7V8X8_PLEWA|nr:hypothetical protein NDU88_001032 [Pleurodeles waltl]